MFAILVVAWLGELIGLITAAASDLRRRVVPNAVVMLLASNGVVLRLAQQAGFLAAVLTPGNRVVSVPGPAERDRALAQQLVVTAADLKILPRRDRTLTPCRGWRNPTCSRATETMGGAS